MLRTAETYGKTLTEIGDKNKDIFVVEADLMKASGSRPFKEKFPDRHINVGVAEQNLVGVAAGIASMGGIPFACTMANFISQRACDQVTISIAFNKFNVKLVGCYAGLSQEKNGGTHIGLMDIAIMRCLPNLRVIVPSDLRELSQALKLLADDKEPAYIRISKVLPESIFDNSYNFGLNKSFQVGDGHDVTIISTGISSVISMDAMSMLAKEGIKARLLHMPVIKPVDGEAIINCANETRAIVTIEDHSVYGGLGGMVSEIVAENYPVPVSRIGLKDVFGITASLDFQLKYFGLTAENLVANVKEILSKK